MIADIYSHMLYQLSYAERCELPLGKGARRRQDSNLRGQSPVDFGSTPLTAWVRLLLLQPPGNRGLTVRILAFQASGPGSTPGGCTTLSWTRGAHRWHLSKRTQNRTLLMLGDLSYLLGLLAKIKCSICSYQLNI